jgi:L,D-peptidoglycan transpeptidase YkuD (ErfK/YbiS/YcfS/YnhG family)
MMLMRRELMLAAAILAAAACRPAANPPVQAAPDQDRAGKEGLTKGSCQILAVVAPDWDSAGARLQAYERPPGNLAWKKQGKEVPAMLGRNGLAWGRGLHPAPPSGEPVKKEGDGRSPAGLFSLGRAFGSFPAGSAEVSKIAMPYLALTRGTECVDDPGSVHYNQIVDSGVIEDPDWKSSEKMLEAGPVYGLGIEINHNRDPVETGAGSCIFLHPWEDEEKGTQGCTGVKRSAMEQILAWLDPGAGPLLVQLPRAGYDRVRKAWRLP